MFSPAIFSEGGWIEFDPSDANTVYSDTRFYPLVKSVDGGVNWVSLNIDQTDNGTQESLAISRTNRSHLLIIRQGNVYLSRDGGVTWTITLNPTIFSLVERIRAVRMSPVDDRHAYAVGDGGSVWHSTDGGDTWQPLGGNLPRGELSDIQVDWSNSLRIYVGFATLGVRHLWRGDLDASDNVTWFDISGGMPSVSLPDLAITGLALDPDFDDTLYVSTMLGVYRSTDGGDSWIPFDYGLPNCIISDLDIRRGMFDRSLYVATMGRGVYRLPLRGAFIGPCVDPTI